MTGPNLTRAFAETEMSRPRHKSQNAHADRLMDEIAELRERNYCLRQQVERLAEAVENVAQLLCEKAEQARVMAEIAKRN